MGIEELKSPETSEGKVARLFEMNPAEKEALQSRIEKFGGMVQVFIHPDFEAYAAYADARGEKDLAEQGFWADAVFKNILSSQSDRVPPIFVFEHAKAAEKFEEKERQLADLAAQPVYVIRTEYADPTPLSPGTESTYAWNTLPISDEERAGAWDAVISELRNLGVKKILIGGAELAVSKEPGRDHAGCLGIAMGKLESFDVKLSTITWPETNSKKDPEHKP